MLITILEVAVLIAIIIVPMAGPSKKKKKNVPAVDRDVTHAHYAVNEEGNLVEIRGRELSGHNH